MGMIDAVEIWDKDRFEKRQASDIEVLNSGEVFKST
jgi:DNA-binding transcriptional regulator/RsmH inhibitor MraZ